MNEYNRFVKNIMKDKNGCWLWQGALNEKGYGQFRFFGRNGRAHQYAYLYFKGMVQGGKVLDHLCRVRHCVNPDHLQPVPNKTNILRGEGFGAVNARKTHCPRGHALTGTNLRFCKKAKHTERVCRVCALEAQRKWKKRVGYPTTRKERAALNAILAEISKNNKE